MQVEHYVISSGMKEIIEGTEISKNFKSIFACEFLYDESGNAVWPKTDVNYTNKTQFVYRINKGVLDVAMMLTSTVQCRRTANGFRSAI